MPQLLGDCLAGFRGCHLLWLGLVRVRIGCLSGDITWRSTVLDCTGDVPTVTGVSSESGRVRLPDLADRLRRAPPKRGGRAHHHLRGTPTRPRRGPQPVDPGQHLAGPNGMTRQPRLLTVNIVHSIHAGYFHDTAIDKQPVDGPVELTATGLAGDRQLNPHHGGSDKAVYAYATEDASWWATQLGRTIPPGLFGENLRTQGLDVSGAIIGEKWRIGTVLLEVRMPRTPCQNLSMRIGIDNFHIRFNTTGRVGAMLKVHEPGPVCAGDPITVVDCPHHGVRVCDLATGPDAAGMQRLLDSGIPLATTVRAKAHRIVRGSTLDPAKL
jgi:MOSC domain-containing protein YiiM